MSLSDDNLAKVQELLPNVQWAVKAMLDSCRAANLQFRITEAFRTPDRQHELWLKGRRLPDGTIVDPGAIVTYDDGYLLTSMHQKRLAFDIFPMNCTYQQVADVAAQFGITHPLTAPPLVDLPHFQCDKVGPEPQPQIINPQVKLAGLLRRLAQEKDPTLKNIILGMINGIKRRLGIH